MQDETAAAIARELHDEIINVSLRLNIEALQQLLAQPLAPPVRDELAQVLASEQTMEVGLRIICERLHPAGLGDLFGLPSVLRMQVERAQATWPGRCALRVEGEPAPIAEPQQREALRIVREGLTNAVKHADATRISVTLRYPARPGDPVTLIVADDGRSGDTPRPRPGHRGVRTMIAGAQAAGGALAFERPAAGGTRLIFTFPAGAGGQALEVGGRALEVGGSASAVAG